MMGQMPKSFSRHLEEWLKDGHSHTLQGLIDHFAEKSFATLFLVLMAIPALPLPTGGATHIFEIVVMLLALELIAGLRQVWLPNRWRGLALPSRLQNSLLPALIKVVRKLEKLSRPRAGAVLKNTITTRMIGLFIFVSALFAFLAPPFSGLDTLPALGIVIMSLAIIAEDSLLLLLGSIVSLVGMGLIIGIGKALIGLI